MLKAAPRHIVPNLLSEISQSVFRICLLESDRPQDLGMAYRCSDALAQRERVRRGGAGRVKAGWR
ncbi:hypothetical protein [Rhodovulum sp. MB263]|uniref:hypothetical protein n=1 Tax=Rhodovulum sp. (strain MB263) TaxID=308754 RepID=UPI0009B73165|nr:hypothetical protein [Rhodovulum sp. MB263]ARC87299.1 hypothetical protein B5V46_00975 [Rhodovulum sp. MB263]